MAVQPLTWRDTVVPDFRGSMEGLRLASANFDRGFGGLNETLTNFDKALNTKAENAIMQRLAAIQDPEQARQALMSGSIYDGINQERIGSAAMQTVMGRPSALLEQATRQQNLEHNAQYLPMLRESQSWQNKKAQQTYLFDEQANPGRLQSLRLGNERASWQFENDKEDRNYSQALKQDQDDANLVVDAAVRQALPGEYRGDTIRRFLSESGLNPRAMGIAQSRFPEIFGGSVGGAGGAPRAATGPATTALSAAATGSGVVFPSSGPGGPVSGVSNFAETIPFNETRAYVGKIRSRVGEIRPGTYAQMAEQLAPHVMAVESGGKPQARSEAGAFGLMQLMPATQRDPGFGVRPAKDDSPEENYRVGKDYITALLKYYNGDVDKALAAYNAGYRNVDKWAAKSAGADLDTTPEGLATSLKTAAAQAAEIMGYAEARVAEDANRSNFIRMDKAFRSAMMGDDGKSLPINDAAKKLREKGGLYADLTDLNLQELISRVQNEAGILKIGLNPAQILEVVQSSIERNWAINPSRSVMGNVYDLDSDRLKQAIKAVADGDNAEQARGSNALLARAARVQDAQKDLEKLSQNLREAQRLAATSGDKAMQRNVSDLLKAYVEKAKRFQQEVNAYNNLPENKPRWANSGRGPTARTDGKEDGQGDAESQGQEDGRGLPQAERDRPRSTGSTFYRPAPMTAPLATVARRRDEQLLQRAADEFRAAQEGDLTDAQAQTVLRNLSNQYGFSPAVIRANVTTQPRSAAASGGVIAGNPGVDQPLVNPPASPAARPRPSFNEVMGRPGFDPWTAASDVVGDALVGAAAGVLPTYMPPGLRNSDPMPPSTVPGRSQQDSQLPVWQGLNIPSWSERQRGLALQREQLRNPPQEPFGMPARSPQTPAYSMPEVRRETDSINLTRAAEAWRRAVFQGAISPMNEAEVLQTHADNYGVPVAALVAALVESPVPPNIIDQPSPGRSAPFRPAVQPQVEQTIPVSSRPGAGVRGFSSSINSSAFQAILQEIRSRPELANNPAVLQQLADMYNVDVRLILAALRQ